MSLPRVLPYSEGFTNAFPAYQCPSTGPLGRALRVNYSMNGWMDARASLTENRIGAARGIQTTTIITPAQKVCLIQEVPETMHNASVIPRTNAKTSAFFAHNGDVNTGFVDGRVESITRNKMTEILSGRNTLKRIYFDPRYR